MQILSNEVLRYHYENMNDLYEISVYCTEIYYEYM